MLLGELLGALSYALDLTEGEQSGHVQRACLIGMGIGQRAGLGERDLADLYYTLLLKDAGCSSNSARIAAVLVADDHRAKRSSKRRDLTRATGRFRHALATAAHDRPVRERIQTLRALATSEGLHRELIRIRCERGASIADNLGFPPAVVEGIRSLDEHWDGNGHPLGLRRRGDPAARAHRRPGADRGDLRPPHRPQAQRPLVRPGSRGARARRGAPARRDRARGGGRGASPRRPPRSRPTRSA